LFREFLRTQASRTLPAKRIDAIRRKAARLLSCSGEVETAVELVREIPDWEALADLVVRHAPILLAQGRVETVDGWLADVPDGVFGRSPWMAYWRAISRLGRGHDDCHIDGERALAGFRRDGDANGMLLAWSLIVLNHVMIGWLPAVDEWIPRLDEILQQCGGPVSPDTQARVAATMLLAIGFRQPAHRDGPSWAARSRALTRDHPDLSLRALAATGWFFYHWVRGEPAKASIVADEMRAIAERDDIPSVVALHAAVPIVWDELLWALPSYRRTVVEMRERAEATGLRHVLQTVILLWGAFAALSHGDDDTADAWIADLGREVEKWGPTFLTAYHGLLILQALARGRTDRAIAFVHEIERLGYSLPNEEVLARVCAAYAFTEARSEEEARRQLARALDVAVTHASRYLEWTVRLADAHCSLAHGDVVRGREALAGAMTIGREGRYINSPVWVPSIMARLCARALDWDIEAQYVRDLVNRRRLVCDPPPVHVERWPWRIKILTLGQFAVLNDDRALRFTGKLQKKPLALLKAMIALGPIRVPEDRLIDALWPDADGDAARRSLTSAVFRLRRMLGNDEVVIRSGGAIGLDSAYCWVDLWAVSRLLDESESAMSADSGERRRLAADAVVRAAELYRGPLSITADDAPWLAGVSDELRRRLVRELLVVAQHSDRAGDLEAAADTLRLALRVDPCSEIAYRRLMVAFHRLGRPAEVKAAYDRCRDSLGRWLGVRPSASTEAVLRQVTSLTEASDR
jgi:DNA-binding SARP family transcriptional activator